MTLRHPTHSVSLESIKASFKNSKPSCNSPTVGANCRGFVTADVLVKGLSRGAISTGYLKGVKPDKGHEGFYTSSAPSMKVKAYV